MKKRDDTIFRIQFYQEKTRYDLYVRHILVNDVIMGFVGVEDIVFNQVSSTVIDPMEEKLQAEFADVSCFYIAYHDVIRIDKVKQRGQVKIIDRDGEGRSNVIRPNVFSRITLPSI